MINVHLYMSTIVNASRIRREASYLETLNIFDSIKLIGRHQNGLSFHEQVSDSVEIVRIPHANKQHGQEGLFSKLVATIGWAKRVLQYCQNDEIACINCHSLSLLPMSVYLKWKTGAKLIYDAHELETEANGLSPLRKKISKVIEKYLINQVDYSIFVGDAINRWYQDHYQNIKSSVILNAPCLQKLTAHNFYREKYGLDKECRIFLYQGLLGEGRGLRYVIPAFEKIDDEKIILVVMGYGPLLDWVKEKARNINNVYFHEAVKPRDLLSYTASADFGVSIIEPTSMSYEYCMPNKLFEYIMSKKPLLVSPTIEQKKLVEENVLGVVCDSISVESIYNAVMEISKLDYDLLVSNISKARLKYNWQNQEKELKKIYKDELSFVTRTVKD